MEAFNIHIPHRGDVLTLTILPEENLFQVIYFGKIAGAVSTEGGTWKRESLEKATLGDLPLYDAEAYPEHPSFLLDDDMVQEIGNAIRAQLSEHPGA